MTRKTDLDELHDRLLGIEANVRRSTRRAWALSILFTIAIAVSLWWYGVLP